MGRKEARFEVVLKDGKPFLRWDQYETQYLRIWKANGDAPYVRWGGYHLPLDDVMKARLRKLMGA